MSSGEDMAGADRIAALIEECRAEREACEIIRARFGPSGRRRRPVYAAVTERLCSTVGEVHAVTLKDDAAPEISAPGAAAPGG